MLCCLGGQALAQSALPTAKILPSSVMLGFETVRLPGGERMGLVGGSFLFDIGDDWGLGPGVYGASAGQRGGLFVGGVEVQKRVALGRSTALALGMYAGGGGGAGAPVGSGLMLRPAVTLLQDLGPSVQGGLSLSSVRFPSGQIRSQQLGLALAWRHDFLTYEGRTGDRVDAPRAGGLGFDRMAITVGQMRLHDGTGRHIGLVGARADRRTSIPGLTWGLEAAAAATGGAAGYMEILASSSYSLAPIPSVLPSWRVGVRGAGGFGGGGSVPAGGGTFAKALLGTEVSPIGGVTVGIDYGKERGLHSGLRGNVAQAWAAVDLEPGLDSRGSTQGHVVRTEWVGTLQHHTKAERKNGASGSLDVVGLKLNRYLGEVFYASGQAHSAYAGGAGAYSIGLIGLGASTSASAPWRVGAELLAGAAGGGGVSTSGGAIVQGLAWAAWSTSAQSELRLGAGKVRSRSGGLSSPVLEVAFSRSFGMAGRD